MSVWGRGVGVSRTPTLADRSDMARAALAAHRAVAGGDEPEAFTSGTRRSPATAEPGGAEPGGAEPGGAAGDLAEQVTALLTDLMHLSFQTRTDFTVLVRSAQRRFCHEHLLAQMGTHHPPPR